MRELSGEEGVGSLVERALLFWGRGKEGVKVYLQLCSVYTPRLLPAASHGREEAQLVSPSHSLLTYLLTLLTS